MMLETPEGYRALDEAALPGFLAHCPAAMTRLGGTQAEWQVREVGDGNLNLVFIVEGPNGSVCVKQALPYVRLVGEGWPLSVQRAFFEHEATRRHAPFAPGLVPGILHYDPALFLIVMEHLTPHIIMRRGMIDGTVYPRFVEQITTYLAGVLFHNSDLGMPAEAKKQALAVFCGNTELCKITEDLIFTDPYKTCERNRWTSPQLDEAARAIREDGELKQAVSRLKWAFLTRGESLLHGDMHTGSIMVTQSDTRVIDPEFAFFGPIGFDVGKLIGNLLLCYFAQRGHEREAGRRDAYRAWILETVEGVWNGFASRFVAHWNNSHGGDAFPPALLDPSRGGSGLAEVQERFMRERFVDALGYAGCSMIRRTLGLAHNADMETIEDADLRAACEKRNLELAVELIKSASSIDNIEAVTNRARAIETGD